jgi:hypothetical protein
MFKAEKEVKPSLFNQSIAKNQVIESSIGDKVTNTF